MNLTKGQLVAITTGEYSDYCLRDHVRVLRDFDTQVEAARFKAEGDYLAPPDWSPSSAPEAYGSDDHFLAWAIREQLIEPLEANAVMELHIGSYGQLEI